MQKEQNLIDLIDKDTNIIDFKTARAGLSTGGTTLDENWLKTLPPGTVFVAKDKNADKNTIVLDLYCVLEHKAVSSNLMIKTPDQRQLDLWFRSLEFSRKNNLVEVIATVEFGYEKEKTPTQEESLTKEIEDGNIDRPI